MEKTKKKFRPMGKVWERPGRVHGSELFVFLVFPWFFAVWPRTSRTPKKKVQTHGQGLGYPHTNQKTKKKKKTKNQETKKPTKTKKTRLHTPRGGGQMQSVGSCLFGFFGFFGFLVFWFFGLDSPDLAHGSELFFFVLEVLGQTAKNHGKTKKTKKTKNQETKKPKNQKTKKPRNQKTKKNKKNKIAHPKGRGSDAECWVLSFWFFWFFWFFGFLVFWLWIAIADVPSRGCQALSVVALEARSIHYSTAMFAMT